MARQRGDERTQALLDEMAKTRVDARTVVDLLQITKKDLAAAAGWNPGYISDFLKETSSKNPTEQKVVALIHALSAFANSRTGAESTDRDAVNAALDRLRDRYGVVQRALVDPATGPIPAQALNYCDRPRLDTELSTPAAAPAFWVIDGRPMSGITSALLRVRQHALDRGIAVLMLSALDDGIATDRLERSATGILGSLAAALTGDDDLLDDPTPASVSEQIEVHLASQTTDALVLMLDDINTLPPKAAAGLKATLRDWSRRQALAEEPYATLSVWLAHTSKIVDARYVSHFQGRGVFVDWFSPREVRRLADSVRPAGTSDGGSSRRDEDGVQLAYRVFQGQPHLTHMFLWDQARGSAQDPLETIPRGAYEAHLERLARAAVRDISRESLECMLDDPPRAMSMGDFREATRLGLLIEPGSPDAPAWSSPYYAKHARDAIRAELEG